jgi:predicted phage gp36 major capsid-like protein
MRPAGQPPSDTPNTDSPSEAELRRAAIKELRERISPNGRRVLDALAADNRETLRQIKRFGLGAVIKADRGDRQPPPQARMVRRAPRQRVSRRRRVRSRSPGSSDPSEPAPGSSRRLIAVAA